MKASVVVEGTLGSLVPRLSPPHDVEALRPQPALWEGLSIQICGRLDSVEFFKVRVSAPLCGVHRVWERSRGAVAVAVLLHTGQTCGPTV